MDQGNDAESFQQRAFGAREQSRVPLPGGTHVFMHCAYRAATHDPGRLTLHLMVYPRWGGPAEEISSWNAGDGDDLTPDPLSRLSPMEIRRAELRWETMPVLAIDYP